MSLRSLLFAPGDSDKKMAKASECGADCVILDIEDSVAASRKPIARDGRLLGARVRKAQGLPAYLG